MSEVDEGGGFRDGVISSEVLEVKFLMDESLKQFPLW